MKYRLSRSRYRSTIFHHFHYLEIKSVVNVSSRPICYDKCYNKRRHRAVARRKISSGAV